MSIAEKLQTIAENEQRVFDAGYAKGQAEGGDTSTAYDEGFEAGKKAEYDAFWGFYQLNGERGTLDFFFAGNGWSNNCFPPKYDMKPVRANSMFVMTGITGDLVELLNSRGVALDFSNCTMVHQLFANANGITRIGVMDFSKVTYGSQWFINTKKLVTIDKLIVSETTVTPSSAFESCEALINLTVEGVIDKNGWNLKWSTKLSKASITSIINALSTTTSGLTVTLSKAAKEAAFTADEWEALEQTKKNWTISLV